MLPKSRLSSCVCVVIAILVACGNDATAPSASTAASSPSTSPRESASSAPVCPNPEGEACLGKLAPGTYTTVVFTPTLTYTVPAGWSNFEDTPGNFLLVAPGYDLAGVNPGTSDYIGVYTRVAACEGPESGVGGSPDDIAGLLTHQRDLQTTTPRQVSVGGLDGVVLDIKLAKGSDACFISGLTPSSLEHGLIPGLTIRLYLLRRSGTLAIEVDDVRGGGNHLDDYSSVVKRMRFRS